MGHRTSPTLLSIAYALGCHHAPPASTPAPVPAPTATAPAAAARPARTVVHARVLLGGEDRWADITVEAEPDDALPTCTDVIEQALARGADRGEPVELVRGCSTEPLAPARPGEPVLQQDEAIGFFDFDEWRPAAERVPLPTATWSTYRRFDTADACATARAQLLAEWTTATAAACANADRLTADCNARGGSGLCMPVLTCRTAKQNLAALHVVCRQD